MERPTALCGKDPHLLELRSFRKVMKQFSVYPPLAAGFPLSPGQFFLTLPTLLENGAALARNQNQNNNNENSDFCTQYLLRIKHAHLKASTSVVMGTPVLASGNRFPVPEVAETGSVCGVLPALRPAWSPCLGPALSWARPSRDPPSVAAPVFWPSHRLTKSCLGGAWPC